MAAASVPALDRDPGIVAPLVSVRSNLLVGESAPPMLRQRCNVARSLLPLTCAASSNPTRLRGVDAKADGRPPGSCSRASTARWLPGRSVFSRATFYRWVEQCRRCAHGWPSETMTCCSRWAICTWRTSGSGGTRERGWSGDQRLDEACELPFTSDLVAAGRQHLAGGGSGGPGSVGESGVHAAARRIPGRTPHRG